jgi:hypothetical protein
METKDMNTPEQEPNIVADIPPVASSKKISKAKLTLLIVAASVLAVSWWNWPPPWVDSFNAASMFSLYEGLPRPGYEAELLEQESQRPDLTMIGSFPFYTPRVAVNGKQVMQFKEIFGDNGLYYPYVGLPKDCGEFHPDFAVEWTDRETLYRLLICFSCGEAQIVSQKGTKHYNVTVGGIIEIESLLSEYSLKRPRGSRPTAIPHK